MGVLFKIGILHSTSPKLYRADVAFPRAEHMHGAHVDYEISNTMLMVNAELVYLEQRAGESQEQGP